MKYYDFQVNRRLSQRFETNENNESFEFIRKEYKHLQNVSNFLLNLQFLKNIELVIQWIQISNLMLLPTKKCSFAIVL